MNPQDPDKAPDQFDRLCIDPFDTEPETVRRQEAETRRIALVCKLFLEKEEEILRLYINAGTPMTIDKLAEDLADLDDAERGCLEAIRRATEEAEEAQDMVVDGYRKAKYEKHGHAEQEREQEREHDFINEVATAGMVSDLRREAEASCDLDRDPRGGTESIPPSVEGQRPSEAEEVPYDVVDKGRGDL